MKRIFSGIQPTGIVHLGNYLGAIKQWVLMQDEAEEAIFCIVDLHAITQKQDREELKKNIFSMAALYLAAGINPEKSKIFVQSTRPEHSELAWILNCITKMGELSRMTQFKEKSVSGDQESTGVGLFDYPVLMAADILLYQADTVPVGEDQKQHVELTRDLAQRFNSLYGDTFIVPEPVIKSTSARIMGLDNPEKKMSKSATSPSNYIAITDDADTIRQKIKRAVTDSGTEIKAQPERPAIRNLINIYSEVTGTEIPLIEKAFEGRGYGDFKEDLAEKIIEFLSPIQEKYYSLLEDQDELGRILLEGSENLKPRAGETLNSVKDKLGLGV